MMKKISAWLLVFLLAVSSMSSCGINKASSDETETTDENESVTESTDAETEETGREDTEETEASETEAGEIITVEYGDYDAIDELRNQIVNFEVENAEITIDGISELIGSSYSIGEYTEDQSERAGISYEVEGFTDDDYPEEGSRVKLTGVLVTEGITHYILVQPDDLEVYDEVASAEESTVPEDETDEIKESESVKEETSTEASDKKNEESSASEKADSKETGAEKETEESSVGSGKNASITVKETSDLTHREYRSFTFSRLPETKEDMEELVDVLGLDDPDLTAALFIAALYPGGDDTIDMINVLKKASTLSEYEAGFVKEQLNSKSYLSTAYYEGASPDNNYTPDQPYELKIYQDEADAEDGYAYADVVSEGDARARRIVLRETKNGEYLIWEYMEVLTSLQTPLSESIWK